MLATLTFSKIYISFFRALHFPLLYVNFRDFRVFLLSHCQIVFWFTFLSIFYDSYLNLVSYFLWRGSFRYWSSPSLVSSDARVYSIDNRLTFFLNDTGQCSLIELGSQIIHHSNKFQTSYNHLRVIYIKKSVCKN